MSLQALYNLCGGPVTPASLQCEVVHGFSLDSHPGGRCSTLDSLKPLVPKQKNKNEQTKPHSTSLSVVEWVTFPSCDVFWIGKDHLTLTLWPRFCPLLHHFSFLQGQKMIFFFGHFYYCHYIAAPDSVNIAIRIYSEIIGLSDPWKHRSLGSLKTSRFSRTLS